MMIVKPYKSVPVICISVTNSFFLFIISNYDLSSLCCFWKLISSPTAVLNAFPPILQLAIYLTDLNELEIPLVESF